MRSIPENLHRISEEASSAFLAGSSTSLTDAVRSRVEGRGLNREQTARVTQMANRLAWTNSSDKMLRFDPANPADVLGEDNMPQPTTSYFDLPPGPASAPPRRERIPLYEVSTERPVESPEIPAEEFGGKAKVAHYEASADFESAKLAMETAAAGFDEAVLSTLWSGDAGPGTIAAALAKVETHPKLTDTLLRHAFNNATDHGVKVAFPLYTLGEDEFSVDENHPVIASFRSVVDAAEKLKSAKSNMDWFEMLNDGAQDVRNTIAARSR